MSHVRTALENALPGDFPTAVAVLERALAPDPAGDSLETPRSGPLGLAGMSVWPMTDYVASRGLPHLERSLAALHRMTRRFTGEFAIRPFIASDPDRALAVITTWIHDPSPQVRRLASEGTRPRLPWGIRLQSFVADPSPCLPILEALYRDPSEFVRRSVANHLNDISKDHPDLAVEIAARWLKAGDAATRKLVSHALRGLVKAGFPPALALLGFNGGHGIELSSFKVSPKTLAVDQTLSLAFSLSNTGARAAKLVIDYAIHHMKSDGDLSPKVFKGTRRSLAPGESAGIVIRHRIRSVTTRRYYPGRHGVDVLVNGRSLAKGAFTLRVAGGLSGRTRKGR